MSLRSALFCLLAAGCQFDTSTSTPRFAADANGEPSIDASSSEPDALLDVDANVPLFCLREQFSFDFLNVGPCDAPRPGGALTLELIDSPYRIDTDTGQLTAPDGSAQALEFRVVAQSNGPSLFVMSVTSFEIGALATLAITGSRPFVLFSTGSIDLFGNIAVATRSTNSGAGGDLDSVCSLGRGTDGSIGSAGGGAGGGGFASDGARGAGLSFVGQGAGGSASTIQDLVPLRGGCAGGQGGGAGGGLGGGAGGALQLVAAEDIFLSGFMSASGAGGRGVAGTQSGGGGGGSGGAILLQSVGLLNVGTITVNGGAGAEGSQNLGFSTAGQNGAIRTQVPALGGSLSGGGGNGGNGGTASEPPTEGRTGSTTNDLAAGGGGGAAGRIRLEIL